MKESFIITVRLQVNDMTLDEASTIVQAMRKQGQVIDYTICTAEQDCACALKPYRLEGK